jgi:MYXO-CTERM domain-containing protein
MAGGAALNASDLYTLGADVISGQDDQKQGPRGSTWRPSSSWVLTRLHLRYTADELKDDLVFQQAKPIIGGRGTPSGEDGTFSEQGAKESRVNQFQARYAILHPWEGEVDCENPDRGVWGGPPSGGNQGPQTAPRTAFAPRGKIELASMVRKSDHDAPGLVLPEPSNEGSGEEEGSSEEGASKSKTPGDEKGKAPGATSSNCSAAPSSTPPEAPAALLALLALLGLCGLRRRR